MPRPITLDFLLLPWQGGSPGPRSLPQGSGQRRPRQDYFTLFKKDWLLPPMGALQASGFAGAGARKAFCGPATLEDDKQPLTRESCWQTEGHNLTCQKTFLFPFTLWGGSKMMQISVPLLHALLAFFSCFSLPLFLPSHPLRCAEISHGV